MAIFFCLIILLILQGHFLSLKWENYSKLFLVLAFIELQIVSGLRIPNGDDTAYYVDTFLEIADMSFVDALGHGLEKGFVVFCYLLSILSKNPQFFLFFTSAFINLLVLYYIYRKSQIPWVSVVLYVTLMHFFDAMNLMRFCMACSVLLYANDFIVRRNFLKFFVIVLLASSFHFSALIYLILYFIYPFKLDIKNIAVLIMSFLMVSVLFSFLFSILIQVHIRYTSYDGGIGEFYQSSYANYLILLMNLFFLLFAMRKENWHLGILKDDSKLYMWTLVITVLMSVMAINVMIVTRFVTMFSYMQIIYIPNLLYKEYREHGYFNWTASLLLLTILQVVVILTFRPEWYFAEPYQNCLF